MNPVLRQKLIRLTFLLFCLDLGLLVYDFHRPLQVGRHLAHCIRLISQVQSQVDDWLDIRDQSHYRVNPEAVLVAVPKLFFEPLAPSRKILIPLEQTFFIPGRDEPSVISIALPRPAARAPPQIS